MWPRGLMYLAKSHFPDGSNKGAASHLNFQLWPVVVDKGHIAAWSSKLGAMLLLGFLLGFILKCGYCVLWLPLLFVN